MEKELDKIIESLPNGIIENHAFFVSVNSDLFNKSITEYKGIEIHYSTLIEENIAYYLDKKEIFY